jgi:hypothetical protein
MGSLRFGGLKTSSERWVDVTLPISPSIFIATYEGSALLANTMRDASVLNKAGRRLDRWIDGL